MMTDELFGLVTREGQPIPLSRVDVKGTLAGRGARVKVIQVFENRESNPVEAVYKFPLTENSAVCRFKTTVGDRVSEGVVEEREKAFQLYDEALTRGDGGCLLDEERPNIFTLSVGNLNPNASALIEIEYVCLLEAKGTEVRFFLPTTISPRYIPGRTPDKKGIPVDSLVNPPLSLDVPYRLSILLEIRGKDTISSVDSPSHPISVEFEDDSIKAEFTSGAAAMDRDFVLTVHYKTLFQNRGYFFSSEKGNFFQLDLCPVESDGTGASSLLKEVVFLLDCSGSMEGSSIQQAKTALEIFLKALMEGVRFNLFRFGSSYEKLFPEGMPYSGENLKKMLNWLKEVDANLGGTEVLGPLKEIYQQRVPDGYSREVILITDGQIGNESEIMDLIRNGDRGSRLFTVGIGYGPNEYFIRQLTRVAGGTSELIAPGERIEPKILRLFRQVMSERMDDLRINWDSSGLHAKQAPFNSSLFTGESVSVFARTKEPSTPPKEIKVSFRKGKGNTEWSVPVQEVKGGEVPLHLLWAKERIRDLEEGTSEGIKRDSMQTERREKQVRDEIIHLSRDFGILSRETSFVATEKRIGDERTTGEVVLRKVPVMLTRGWGGVQVNMAPTMAMPAMMARPSATQFSMRRVLREHASQMKPAERFEASEGTSVSFLVRDRGPVSRTDELGEDILMNILSLQRVEGGFEIDEGLCEEIGVTVAELKKLSRKIKTTEKADGFILLSTAILLQLLNRYFIDREGTWKSIVEKTEKWFMRELSRTEPRIDGIPLGEWAVQFVSTHSLRRMP